LAEAKARVENQYTVNGGRGECLHAGKRSGLACSIATNFVEILGSISYSLCHWIIRLAADPQQT